MHWHTLFTGLLLATGVHGGVRLRVAEGSWRSSPSPERRLQEMVQAELAARTYTQRAARGAAAGAVSSASSGVALSADGSVNATAWDATAKAACERALGALPAPSNPAGTTVCYNLPALDNTTGAFTAELRLYTLSEPTGPFAGISPRQISVSLQYHGASVMAVQNTSAPASPTGSARRDDSVKTSLKLMRKYLLVGQIDKTRMRAFMNMAQLEALVLPTVTLTTLDAKGQTVSTNVTVNEAAFVAGVFSDRIVLSDEARAQLAVDAVVAGLRNGTVTFVLPGTQLLIAPIGLIITSTWLIIGLVVYGVGTMERINHVEIYKRAVSRSLKGHVARI